MPIPKPTELLLGTPLYAKVPYDKDEAWEVLGLIYFKGTYDSYCVKCMRESTFQAIAPDRPPQFVRNLAVEAQQKKHGIKPDMPNLDYGLYQIHAQCTRVETHKQDFVFYLDFDVERQDGKPPLIHRFLFKIGQQPSFGDLHIVQSKKYTHVLTRQQLGELTRAIGLASHDVGVGAYVYLRRVFEALVEEAHLTAERDTDWDEDTYQRSRMSEKIALLRSHLPPFLVEHPGMYSLLSKGVHELTEDECLKNFDTLRLGIELILDEKLEQRERERKVAQARAAIHKALGDGGA